MIIATIVICILFTVFDIVGTRTVVKFYVTLVLNCGWHAHTPSVWIPGTEDMEASYRNYKFYLSSIPRSLLAGAIVGVIIGGIMELI